VSALRSVFCALGLLATGAGSTRAAQDVASAAPQVAAEDTAPTFDQLARRVLTLKVEVEWLRGRLDASGRSGRPVGWTDSVAAVRAGLGVLDTDARRLKAAYQSARHDKGVKLATELVALVGRASTSFSDVARARDERSARTAITHLAAGLDALLQKIAEGEACCAPPRAP
jgi:hypothetical protein